MTDTTTTTADLPSLAPPAPLLNYSQINQHRKCPQKWHYSQLKTLRTIDTGQPSVALGFGSWWHALMAADSITRGLAAGTLLSMPDQVTTVDGGPVFTPTEDGLPVEVVLAESANWWATLPNEAQEEWTKRLGTTLFAQLTNLYRRWLARWEAERANEQPVGVEVEWERDLVAGGQVLRGTVDEVYWDIQRGILVARDHKTAKTFMDTSAVGDMMDSQLQIYAWGVSPLIEQLVNGPDTRGALAASGGKIGATAYDRVRSPQPKTPELTISGTLKKSVTDYDLDTYADWCEDGVPYPGRGKTGEHAGVYLADPKIIEKLNAPVERAKWFQRSLTPLNANLIAEHLRAAWDTGQDMKRTRARVERSGAAPRNLSRDCSWCDYSALCRAQMIGGADGDYPLADYGLIVGEPRR